MVGESTSLHHLHRLELLQTRLLCDLVLALVSVMLEVSHVCDVADITHLVSKMLEQFHEYIISHTRTSMSQMRVAVYCRTADIKSHMPLIDRLENLFLSRKGVSYI